MTLTSTLRIALSGLQTAQRALAVTANNVANAGTEGYVRKRHAQEAVVFDGLGAGVRTLDPRRVVDEHLVAELRSHNSRLGRSEILAEFLGRAQDDVFGSPGEAGLGIHGRLAAVATAAEALADDPGKVAQRAQLVGAAEALAAELARAGEQVQRLRREADQRIAQVVSQINAAVAALHEINRQVASGRGGPELDDRRDQLLAELARKVDISTYRMDDGRIGVFLRGGQPLLEGEPRVLVYDPAPAVARTTLFGPIGLYAARDVDPATGRPLPGARAVELVTAGLRAELPPELATGTPDDEALLIRSRISGGELSGLLDARDRLLPELADQLDELARIVHYALNAAHNAGTAWPPPERLTGTRPEDGTFDAATREGTAWLAVIDRQSGLTLHTVAIDLSADLATLVAQLDADLGGYGDAALDPDGRLAITLGQGLGIALADGDGRITVEDAAGRSWVYGFSHYFGLNDLLVAEPGRPTALVVRPELTADLGRLATARLDVDPGPPPLATLGGAGDNRGAQGLAAAFARSVTTIARGALGGRDVTIGAYAADVLGLTATRAAQLRDVADADRVMHEALSVRSAEVSGVNMDEELARLVLYQQSYTVAARIVQITDRLFDELLNIRR